MTNRYIRQIKFKEIGKAGQDKVSNSTIAIVGVGGLGSVSAELLARAGVKRIILVDFDKIDITNLQRQALYTEADINKPKVVALKNHLRKINSNIEIKIYNEKLAKDNIGLIKSDIILDGTDNNKTRLIINEFAYKNKIPFIYGSAAATSGMVYNVTLNNPCLNCIIKEKDSITSKTHGIISPLTHVIASLQVTECLKILLNKSPQTDLVRIDIWNNNYSKIKVKKRPKCRICANI